MTIDKDKVLAHLAALKRDMDELQEQFDDSRNLKIATDALIRIANDGTLTPAEMAETARVALNAIRGGAR
ncbi:MAG TPA: hypothetical protein VJ652_14955 [Noviherbaspirillum sp.]|nr:hypothetical protein [Noviherbaspirillum sp.]